MADRASKPGQSLEPEKSNFSPCEGESLTEYFSNTRTAMNNSYIWKPSPVVVEYSNVARLMRRHRITTYRDLIARSTGEIEWFWRAAVEDLNIEFQRPFDALLDASGGIAWTTWFRGGTINLAHQCLDRHAQSRGGITLP